jgi:3-hydroxyacyl-CoA dehydrogenase
MKPELGGQLAGYAAAVGKLFQQMAGRGWLGQKSGMGFYRYRGRRRRPNPEAALLLQNTDLRGTGLDIGAWLPPQLGESRDRLVLSMVNAAAACVGEGLADTPETIDLAMVLGTGWAPHRGGPLHYADARGLNEVVRVLAGLATRLGPWFEPCAELQRRSEHDLVFCPAPTGRQEA